MPFTTPMLIGARARPTIGRGIELIVPNPSGGSGVYLFDWSALDQFCQPSLHDLALTEGVERLPIITPATIRRAAQQVAADGLAGREVAEAAATALRHEQFSGMQTNFFLLIALMQQIEDPLPGQLPADRENPFELQKRAKRAIAVFAPKIGVDAREIANQLERLADMFVRIGVGANASQAFLPSLGRDLHRFRRDLAEWGSINEGPIAETAFQIAAQADSTLRLAEPLVESAQARARDVVQLLRNAVSASARLEAELSRADWLLDGWELACLRWRTAAPQDRETVLEELAAMLPTVPYEAEEWGYNGSQDIERSWMRKVRLGHDWRTGLETFRAIARSEMTLKLAYTREGI